LDDTVESPPMFPTDVCCLRAGDTEKTVKWSVITVITCSRKFYQIKVPYRFSFQQSTILGKCPWVSVSMCEVSVH